MHLMPSRPQNLKVLCCTQRAMMHSVMQLLLCASHAAANLIAMRRAGTGLICMLTARISVVYVKLDQHQSYTLLMPAQLHHAMCIDISGYDALQHHAASTVPLATGLHTNKQAAQIACRTKGCPSSKAWAAFHGT